MSLQLMFIYTDNGRHDRPMDVASVSVVQRVGERRAFAGAVWIGMEVININLDGSPDRRRRNRWADRVYPDRNFNLLTDRDFCVAWDVRRSDEFADFLAENGYERVEVEDEEP